MGICQDCYAFYRQIGFTPENAGMKAINPNLKSVNGELYCLYHFRKRLGMLDSRPKK